VPSWGLVRDREDDPIDTPPEGASCGEHPERDALVTCPRCGSFCCLACWHNSVRRCHACLMKDPGPPVPWEDRERGLPMRFLSTLADAFRPNRSAPAFARGDWRGALSFFALTFVPLAILSGIIPYTVTLQFGPAWGTRLLGRPSSAEIAIDVVRAGGVGLLVSIVMLVLLTVPYYSLSRAYGSRGHAPAPVSVMFYRAWLIPLSQVVRHVVIWSLPLSVVVPEPSMAVHYLLEAAAVIWLILLFASMLSTARMASGVGPFASMAVVIVPFIVLSVGSMVAAEKLSPFLPRPPDSAVVAQQ
jgi:hypothetical protein